SANVTLVIGPSPFALARIIIKTIEENQDEKKTRTLREAGVKGEQSKPASLLRACGVSIAARSSHGDNRDHCGAFGADNRQLTVIRIILRPRRVLRMALRMEKESTVVTLLANLVNLPIQIILVHSLHRSPP